MKAKTILLLFFSLAIFLRVLYFDSITFFYDQARDALTSMEIWQKDPVKILGPRTDFEGLYHGPAYWYLISPFYFLSGGNVRLVKLVLIILNSISILFIYDLSQSLFNKKVISFLSAFLFAISFETVQYARWLSNPAPAILTTIISYWALYRLIQGKKWALFYLLVSWGISLHFQLFLLYQLPIFILIWLLSREAKLLKISRAELYLSLSGFLLVISPFIAAEVKFKFRGLKTLLGFFKTQTQYGQSFWSMFTNYIDRLSESFFINVWGINLFLAGILTIITFYLLFKYIQNDKNRKELTYLTTWILSPVLINLFSGPNSRFINLGISVPIIITTSYFIIDIVKNRILITLILLTIIIGNINLITTKNKEGETLFSVQKQMTLSDELKVIDWIYKEANGKPYKLNTITNPLFINSTWAHLFNWYGKSKYGYMPIWWGEAQVDVPGANVKFADDSPTDKLFLIIEPGASGDDNYVKAIKLMENTRSELVKSESVGYFNIEERKITKERIYTSQDVFYVIKNTDLKELQKVN